REKVLRWRKGLAEREIDDRLKCRRKAREHGLVASLQPCIEPCPHDGHVVPCPRQRRRLLDHPRVVAEMIARENDDRPRHWRIHVSAEAISAYRRAHCSSVNVSIT